MNRLLTIVVATLLLAVLLAGCHAGDFVLHPIVDYREPSPAVVEVLAEIEEETGRDCIDLNTADVEKLQLIVHIGPFRAGHIADIRGLFEFNSVDDLRIIGGLAERRLADIKEQGLVCGGD